MLMLSDDGLAFFVITYSDALNAGDDGLLTVAFEN